MDPIADMLTTIRNAQAVKKETVSVPYSNIKYNLVKILQKQGFVEDFEKKANKKKPFIIISLKYNPDGTPQITTLKRVSKPGQRIYVKYTDLREVKGGYGKAIISTPQGLLTGEEARKKKVGGEYLAEIW